MPANSSNGGLNSSTNSKQASIAPCLPESLLSDPAGIGLRHPYYQEILDSKPKLGWFEIHPENYFGGGINRYFLGKIRQSYPISMHAVGLSLGSSEAVSDDHLRQLKELIDIYEPFIVSDHASWSASGNAHLNDLLPLPYNQETLDALCRNIDKTQTTLKRTILIENPSTYLTFKNNEMSEWEFLNEAARKTGCYLLLDVNNIYVQSQNHNFDPYEYLDNINMEKVREIHLAGHIERDTGHGIILVDTHSRKVKDIVWDMYTHTIKKTGTIPTLIEWDQDFPPLETLLAQADNARKIMKKYSAKGG